MYKDWKKLTGDLGGAMKETRAGIPETWGAFSDMAAAATKDGALDPKTKELLAVAISIAVRCDGCIAFHVRGAVKNGATREEMLETIGIALFMGGGPSSVYGAQALEAFDQFSAGK
ncbi:carboxymuconolactone decarboxylase family protein [Roseospirillum parvum]|uniref:Alkylhydroperoxidase AhpD family core domain-containing protein n=1 Tax=Roseospirillum parvum TaxID=83401 RepID=A0A1G7U341_9PROT|nr:carboxymuconolactone decarboxylase family protein [Roseospirillum parvum]SDG41986.1 alkylhydroperoxidase AhpD family core domain-containing protein [Roseospirillum parvum]